MMLGRGYARKAESLHAMHGGYGSLNNDQDGTFSGGGSGGGSGGSTTVTKFQHDLYLNLRKDLWQVQNTAYNPLTLFIMRQRRGRGVHGGTEHPVSIIQSS